jgi:hypothetical protein
VSEPAWLPIQYRDFYDIPRLIVVERGGQLYLFDCPFDDESDEYSDHFTVYRLPSSARGRLDDPSWLDLAQLGEVVGRVTTDGTEFDPSRRRFLSDAVFRRLAGSPPAGT